MNHIRILLVDDHTLFRSGVKALLQRQEDFEVVGEASDGLFFEVFESTLDGQADDDGDGLEELLEDLKRLRSTVARPDGDMGEAYEAFLAMSGGFTA